MTYTVPPDQPAQTRRAAADAGMVRYWTGKPCRRGHRAWRYVTTGSCIACTRMVQDAYSSRQAVRAAGMETLTVVVHPNDAATVVALVDALGEARR